MMQKTPALTDISPPAQTEKTPIPPSLEVIQGQPATVWVGRITSIIGAICLFLALLEWATRPGHLRTVLALLTIAMFAAILHSYTFEDGS